MGKTDVLHKGGGAMKITGSDFAARNQEELAVRIDRAWSSRVRWNLYRWCILMLLVILVCTTVSYAAYNLDAGEENAFPPVVDSDTVKVVTLDAGAEVHEKDVPVYFTDADVDALAKTLWGEARGIESDMEKAAVVWCVLNRVDDESGLFPDTIVEVVTAPYQFDGYAADNPVEEHLEWLVKDVLIRWASEKEGHKDVGRVLPKDYVYFLGDGRHNYFTVEWLGDEEWDWSLPNPYLSERGVM